MADACPHCGERSNTSPVHLTRCAYVAALRDDLQTHAFVAHGMEDFPAVVDLFAHLRNIYDDGTLAHLAARKVLDLGWRPGTPGETERIERQLQPCPECAEKGQT